MVDNALSPHGGRLVERVVDNKEEALKLVESCRSTLTVRGQYARDIVNIAYGFLSPLEGFMNQEEMESVCRSMTLPDGLLWPLPIVLDVSDEEVARRKITKGQPLLLEYHNVPFAVMHVEDIYDFDQQAMIKQVYGMDMADHPGIKWMHSYKDKFLGGPVELINPPIFQDPYADFFYTPRQLREKFARRHWRRILAYHTRTVPHAGHEGIMKAGWFQHNAKAILVSCAVGEKRIGECIDETVLLGHQELVKSGYLRESVCLVSMLLWDKRYAGPREAIMHAIIRKNTGATGHVFGPGHAGVEGFYDKWAAQAAFRDLPDLGIKPVVTREWFYCPHCGEVAYSGLCGHTDVNPEYFSEEGVCSMLSTGVKPADYMLRQEVFDTIIGAADRYGFGDGYVTEEYLQRRNPIFTLAKF
jgi:sulfate adenylyltransferase